MKLRLIVALTISAIILGITPNSFAVDPPLASCLSFKGETSSISSYAISISVPVYQKCGMLIHWGDFALITVDGDDGLLGAGSCSSFLLAQGSATLGEVYSGIINCTIVVSGWQASKRSGQTSSTLRVKYVWDNSSTSVTVGHPPIPAVVSPGGGTTGGTITPSCSSAPRIPNLSYSILTDGIQFTSTAQSAGDKATNLYYSYSYFNGSKGAWQGWIDWISATPTTTISFKAPSGSGNTYVAFGVYASNNCGLSPQARESANHFGLQLPELPASIDAVKEATDAANAETDAANTVADNSNSEVINAQNAADQVEALSAQIEEIISGLKSQLLTLNALVLKIQAKK